MTGPMTELTWFTRPSDAAAGTLNAVYDALDRPVVRGHADDAAVTTATEVVSYAVLLERVAAFGGLLKALGVREGDAVAVTAPVSPETVVAVLAAVRIGAVPWLGAEPAALVGRSDPPLVVAEGTQRDAVVPAVDALDRARPRAVVVVRAGEWALLETRDVAWEPALKAGATDPAPVVPVPSDAAVVVGVDEGEAAGRPHLDVSRTPAVAAVEIPHGSAWSASLVLGVLAALPTGRGVRLT